MKKLTLTAVFIKEEDGGFTGIIEELRGVVTYGDTLAEAKENMHEAISMFLEANKEIAEKELKASYGMQKIYKENYLFA